MELNYTRMTAMEPLPGRRYSTTYIVQRQEDRKAAHDQLRRIVTEILTAIEADAELRTWFEHQPLPGFPTAAKRNRTPLAVVQELLEEFQGTKRNGQPKDIALAPIERWNRLFGGTQWAIELKRQ